jgi:hypothetical protein
MRNKEEAYSLDELEWSNCIEINISPIELPLLHFIQLSMRELPGLVPDEWKDCPMVPH